MSTVAQLGARALRKLGIAVVADASRPESAPVATAADVAVDMMRQMNIPVADADRPASLGTIGQGEIASRALRAVGVNPAAIIASIGTNTTLTLDQIATAALRKLAVIASDESPADLDQAEALARANAAHDMLVAMDFVTWPASAVPDQAAEAYIVMVANLIAPQFGKVADMTATASAQAMIRQQALSGVFGQALAEARVQAVHEELNALGIVSWPVTAVPLAQAQAYVQMTAVQLSPIYKTEAPDDRKTGEEIYGAAMASIRRAAQVQGAYARAADRVLSVHEELNALGLVTWTPDTIPRAMSDLYSVLAASKMTAEGGKPMDNAEYGAAVSRIRLMAMGGPAGQALAEQKIRVVQYSLEARGRARWTLMDVPVWAEEPLVLMAAALLAPECGVKADPSWSDQAERELMRIVSLPSEREPVRAVYF
jgi:hypothetical protein